VKQTNDPPNGGKDDVNARRAVVRELDFCGLRRGDILRRMRAQGFYRGNKNPTRALDNDLAVVRRKKAVGAPPRRGDESYVEYVARLDALYQTANASDYLQQRGIKDALELAKAKARAKGIKVDETRVIEVQGPEKYATMLERYVKTEHNEGDDETGGSEDPH